MKVAHDRDRGTDVSSNLQGNVIAYSESHEELCGEIMAKDKHSSLQEGSRLFHRINKSANRIAEHTSPLNFLTVKHPLSLKKKA